MKNKKVLDLKVDEAIQLIKTVVIDDKIRQEFNQFIDKVGENANVCIKEVVNKVSENVVSVLTDALSNKVGDIKSKVEGDGSHERKPNDGPDLGGEDRKSSHQEA